jgi:hypothetical protein
MWGQGFIRYLTVIREFLSELSSVFQPCAVEEMKPLNGEDLPLLATVSLC